MINRKLKINISEFITSRDTIQYKVEVITFIPKLYVDSSSFVVTTNDEFRELVEDQINRNKVSRRNVTINIINCKDLQLKIPEIKIFYK